VETKSKCAVKKEKKKRKRNFVVRVERVMIVNVNFIDVLGVNLNFVPKM